MKGFLSFLREHAVALAVGFIMGTSVSKVVTSLVDDIIDPLLGFVFGHEQALQHAYLQLGTVKINWGNFVNTTIEFFVIALIVYLTVRVLGLCPPGKKCD